MADISKIKLSNNVYNVKDGRLANQTAYTSKGSSTKVPQITTNSLGQVTNITEVTITDNNDNQKVKTSTVNFGVNDTVEIVGGTNVTVTGDSTAKTITISATDTDTGATSIETTGSGNAVTTASYDDSTRKITLTKGSTFLTSHQNIKTLKTDNTTAQDTSSSEAIKGSGTINLHKIAKTGTYSDLIGRPTIPTVNDATLTIKVAGTSKGTFTANASSDTEVNITAEDLGLSSAMKFLGVTTTVISDGSTTNPITIGEKSVTATTGNVVIYGSLEFVWDGSAWELLGQDGSYALNSVTVTGTGALGGGGNLTANRTITHNEVLGTAQNTADVYKVKIDKYGHISEATSANLSTVATSGSYNDLSDKPTIPTVNDGKFTLSVTKDGTTTTGTFTANQSSNTSMSISFTTETWSFEVEGEASPVTKTVITGITIS